MFVDSLLDCPPAGFFTILCEIIVSFVCSEDKGIIRPTIFFKTKSLIGLTEVKNVTRRREIEGELTCVCHHYPRKIVSRHAAILAPRRRQEIGGCAKSQPAESMVNM